MSWGRGYQEYQCQHPLQNSLILDSISKYLELDDLLKCRLINRKWYCSCMQQLKANNFYTIKLTGATILEYINFLKSRSQSLEWCNNYLLSLELRRPSHGWWEVPGPLKDTEKMMIGNRIDIDLLLLRLKEENLTGRITDMEISLDSNPYGPHLQIRGLEFVSLVNLRVIVNESLTRFDWEDLQDFVFNCCSNLKTLRFKFVGEGIEHYWGDLYEMWERGEEGYDLDFRNRFPGIAFSYDLTD